MRHFCVLLAILSLAGCRSRSGGDDHCELRVPVPQTEPITYKLGELKVWAGNGVLSVDPENNRVLSFAYHPTSEIDKENYLVGFGSTRVWQTLSLTPQQLAKYNAGGGFDVRITAEEFDDLKSLYAAYHEADAKKEPAAKRAMGAAIRKAGDRVREQLQSRSDQMRTLLSADQINELKRQGPTDDVRSVRVAEPPTQTTKPATRP